MDSRILSTSVKGDLIASAHAPMEINGLNIRVISSSLVEWFYGVPSFAVQCRLLHQETSVFRWSMGDDIGAMFAQPLSLSA